MNAPERTMKKIEKEQAKLDSLFAKRDELESGYQAQVAKLNESIEEATKNIELLRKQEKNEKLVAVATVLNKNSISVDELYQAALNKDFYSLQERLEKGALSKNDEMGADESASIAEESNVETSDDGTYEANSDYSAPENGMV